MSYTNEINSYHHLLTAVVTENLCEEFK